MKAMTTTNVTAADFDKLLDDMKTRGADLSKTVLTDWEGNLVVLAIHDGLADGSGDIRLATAEHLAKL